MIKVLHYSSKSKGLGFMKPIREILETKLDDDTYECNKFANQYKEKLKGRVSKSDVNIITSHGQKNAIISMNGELTTKEITEDDIELFKNNLVFAFACDTLQELGQIALNNGVLTYIGFEDHFSTNFIELVTDDHKKYNENIVRLAKSIFTINLAEALVKFIDSAETASIFFTKLRFRIEKDITKSYSLSWNELNSRYGTNFTSNDEDRLESVAQLNFLDIYEKVFEVVKLEGEKHFVFWKNLSKLRPEKVVKLIKSIKTEMPQNKYYEYFIKAHCYNILNDVEEYKKHFDLLEYEIEKCGTEFDYSSLQERAAI